MVFLQKNFYGNTIFLLIGFELVYFLGKILEKTMI